MAVVHDTSPQGRLIALLEMCEMHARRRDMEHMPGLLALIDQTRRVIDLDVLQSMEQRQIQPRKRPGTGGGELPI